MNFDPYIIQKWMTDLNVTTKTIQNLEGIVEALVTLS